MKRIQSLDILRGVGLLYIVTMHAFQKTGWWVIGNVLNDLSVYPWYMLAPLGIIVFLSTWRALFMLISGVVNMYGIQRALKQGKSVHIVCLKRILSSILLFIQGMAIQVYFNPYTGLYRYLTTGIFDNQAYLLGLSWSDAVEVIAIGLFISTVLHYIFILISTGIQKITKKQNESLRIWISISINLTLMIVILVIRSYVVNQILGATEFDNILQIKVAPIQNIQDRIRLLGLALLIGEQQPIFPYLSATFLGNALGIALTHPKFKKKYYLLFGFIIGLLICIASVFVGLFVEHFEISIAIVPNQWYYLATLGVQVWIFILFLWIFDFSKKAAKRVKYTKLLRKAGILSLTIFSMQWIDYFPRLVLTVGSGVLSSMGIGKPLDFLSNGGLLGVGAALLTAFLVLVFWIGLLSWWEKVSYAFSFDWIFEILRLGISGQKINWRDPLRSQNIIYNAEIIYPEQRK